MNQNLFQPITFGNVTVKNRVVMAPMVTNFAGPDDEVTDDLVSYYTERARGGVGAIVVEASPIRSTARISPRQVGSYEDRFISGLSRLTRTIREAGAVALLQLCHGGPKTLTETGRQTESVSEKGVRMGDVPRRLSIAELDQVRRDFVDAAGRAKRAGFDGIELHAAHFYLLSAFISPFTNDRSDPYGGGIQNRARLTREVIEDIKAAHGAEFPVWVRINALEDFPSGLTLDDAGQAAAIFVEAGADAIHVSAYATPTDKGGIHKLVIPVGGAPGKSSPQGSYLGLAAAIRKVVDVPVIAVGKLDNPTLAANALFEGMCDMIALARQLLCDPYWPCKVKEERENEIIHCTYCGACHNALQKREKIVCAVNLNLFGEPVYKQSSEPEPEK